MSSPPKLSATSAAATLSSRRSPTNSGFAMKAAQQARSGQAIQSVKSSETVKSAEELEIIGHIGNSTRITSKPKHQQSSRADTDVGSVNTTPARIQRLLDNASVALDSASAEASRSVNPTYPENGAVSPRSPATRRFDKALRAASPEKHSKPRPDSLSTVQQAYDHQRRGQSPRNRPPTPEGDRDRSSERSVSSQTSGGSSSRRSLDLAHNDNAFHVIANIVVERLEQGDGTLTNHDGLDQTVPPSIRESFCQAVRYRLRYNNPANSQAHVHVLTRKCGEYGLDNEGLENPLLRVKPPPSTGVPKTPVSTTRTTCLYDLVAVNELSN